jgi:hypothetical protein
MVLMGIGLDVNTLADRRDRHRGGHRLRHFICLAEFVRSTQAMIMAPPS